MGDSTAGTLDAASRLRRYLAVRAVVLTGAGAAFCAGMDTSGFDQMWVDGRDAKWRPDNADERARQIIDLEGLVLGRGQRTVLVWRTLPVPVLAAVHGTAVGLGLKLALGADIRIVAPDAVLAQSMAARAPEAVRSVVRLIRLGAVRALQSGLQAEREEMWRNIGSDNQREAVAAAREHRSPAFRDPVQDVWTTR